MTDENEPPVFLNEPYTGTVAENVDVEVPKIAKVTAEDYDFEGIQTVRWVVTVLVLSRDFQAIRHLMYV